MISVSIPATSKICAISEIKSTPLVEISSRRPRNGDTYVSPFLGRLDDISTRGVDLISEIAQIFEVAGIDTEIIAASVRNPIHVTDCALAGADIATVPYKVIEQMTHHPLTDAGIEKFQADYKAVFGE